MPRGPSRRGVGAWQAQWPASCSAAGCLGLGGGRKEGSVQRPELRPDLGGRMPIGLIGVLKHSESHPEESTHLTQSSVDSCDAGWAPALSP